MEIKDNIGLRLTPEECIVLGDMMRENGWENISGFCKRKIFGKHVDVLFVNRQKRHAEKGEKEFLLDAIYRALSMLSRQNESIFERYQKDIETLKKDPEYSHEKFEDYVGKSLRAFRKRQDRMANLVQKLMNIIIALDEDDNSKK